VQLSAEGKTLSLRLTRLQKKLCNELQDGLSICSRPFADLAQFLNSDEQTLLREIRQLKEAGLIRRIRALINHRALGLVSTLVAAHVGEENVQAVAQAINSLDGVSHNYLRKHNYNMWFTLQAPSEKEIEVTLSNLSQRVGVDFHSLPVERVFKLDVRFDAQGEAQPEVEQAVRVPKDQTVELTDREKQILSRLQGELEVTSKPFDFLRGQGLSEQQVLAYIRGLIDKGVIRRIAAVVDYRKLGYVANVMFCCAVGPQRVVEAGEKLALFRIVSHCYERRTFQDWPYNLFAMMHAQSMGQIQHVVDKFVQAEKIDSFDLLPTEAELKKRPVSYHFRQP
jgi:DNA-binding Lrp family transcriptional regulator